MLLRPFFLDYTMLESLWRNRELNQSELGSNELNESWKPSFNFAKGSFRFGDSCQYVHDANARVTNANSGFSKGRGTSENTTNDLLTKLLAQLAEVQPRTYVVEC
uniref:C3H1-type domain-containing protein n=1 Tax=Tanacetum cinerariifolium TaxID=118510 RepID=A0A6L2N878_TANCI|nr:hypothetical protein [Tanacetum cinerariifolium]